MRSLTVQGLAELGETTTLQVPRFHGSTMRTLLTVLTVVLLNDVALLAFLDVTSPELTVVLGGALVLTAAVFAIVSVGVEDDRSPPSRRELQEEVEALRERVDAFED
jgi:hypothetical protein